MSKIKFKGTGRELNRGEVHFKGPSGGDYTLCGLTLDSDPGTTGDYIDTMEASNCRECREIIEYCKSLNLNQNHEVRIH